MTRAGLPGARGVDDVGLTAPLGCSRVRMLRTRNLDLELLEFESPDQVAGAQDR